MQCEVAISSWGQNKAAFVWYYFHLGRDSALTFNEIDATIVTRNSATHRFCPCRTSTERQWALYIEGTCNVYC